MFNGSYIRVILDIAKTDPHCKLSFVKSDIENAYKELAKLQELETAVKEHFAVTQIPTSMLRQTEIAMLDLIK